MTILSRYEKGECRPAILVRRVVQAWPPGAAPPVREIIGHRVDRLRGHLRGRPFPPLPCVWQASDVQQADRADKVRSQTSPSGRQSKLT